MLLLPLRGSARSIGHPREGEAVIFDRALCDGCRLCAKECPGKALQIAGVERDTADVLKISKGHGVFTAIPAAACAPGGERLTGWPSR